MSCFASKTTIAPSSGSGQSAAFIDFVSTALTSAGATRVYNFNGHGTGNIRGALFRLPQLGPYNSMPDLILIHNLQGNSTAQISASVFDGDLMGQSATNANVWTGSVGTWSNSALFPSTGTPNTSTAFGNNSNSNGMQVSFNSGGSTWTCRAIVSEYGLMVVADNGTNQTTIHVYRPMDDIRGPRDVGIQCQQGSFTSAGQTHTIGAPSGAEHLSIEIEGITFNVTFPNTALNSYRFAQELTRQLGGMGEASVRSLSPQAQGEVVRFRIPPDRAPVGNYSTVRPRIRLLYQDPTVISGGLDFSLVSATTMTSVTTGVGGNVQLSTKNWPAIGARIGTVVYNRTRSSSASATGFTTTTNPMDTIVLDTVPGSWVAGDTYDILPCYEHQDGLGAFQGSWQACLQSNPFTTVAQGASRTLVLNDLYGEAQTHFQVGQSLFLANSALSMILPVNASPAGMKIGDTLTNNTKGSLGIVRAIDTGGNRVLVDTTQGASSAGSPFNGDPWNNGDSITASGVTVSINSTIQHSSNQGSPTTGWFGLAKITAISQVSASDPRSTITVDLTAVNVNTGLVLFPSFIVGTRAKQMCNLVVTTPGSGSTVFAIPEMFPTTISSNTDIQRSEVGHMTNPPVHVPDYETYSYQLAEWVMAWNSSNAPFGNDLLGRMPHLRSVNAKNVTPTIGDTLEEDFDSNRTWIPIGQYQSGAVGAGTTSNANHWMCIGPGGVA